MIIPTIFFILLLFAIFTESVFIAYPVVFIILALFFLFKKDMLYFFFAFFAALIIDVLTVKSQPVTLLAVSFFLLFTYIFEKVFAEIDVRLFLVIIFLCAEIVRFTLGYSFQPIISIIVFISLMIVGIFLHKLQMNTHSVSKYT